MNLENAVLLPALVKRVKEIVTQMMNVAEILSVVEIIVISCSSGIRPIVVKSQV